MVQNRHDAIAMKRVAQRFWAPCGYRASSLVQFASTSYYWPLESISTVDPRASSQITTMSTEARSAQHRMLIPTSMTLEDGTEGPGSRWAAS